MNVTKPIEVSVQTRNKDLMYAIEQHFDKSNTEYITKTMQIQCRVRESGYIEVYTVKAFVWSFSSADLVELERDIQSKDFLFKVDCNIDAFIR